MSIMLENKQGLIAGDGILPVEMARHAKENGFEVVCISLADDNLKELKKYCSKVYSCHPGEMTKIEKIFADEEIKQVTFLGKVHKRVLLQLHKFDKQAIDMEDVNYGFWLAKEMGKVDVGQSVVIKDKMAMAVEAIEGTDMCIKRGCKNAKRNAVIVKVSKPSQDKRFDIPAIGLRTLKTMKKYKASLIAVEANETIIVNQEKVIEYADRYNIVIMAV